EPGSPEREGESGPGVELGASAAEPRRPGPLPAHTRVLRADGSRVPGGAVAAGSAPRAADGRVCQGAPEPSPGGSSLRRSAGGVPTPLHRGLFSHPLRAFAVLRRRSRRLARNVPSCRPRMPLRQSLRDVADRPRLVVAVVVHPGLALRDLAPDRIVDAP